MSWGERRLCPLSSIAILLLLLLQLQQRHSMAQGWEQLCQGFWDCGRQRECLESSDC